MIVEIIGKIPKEEEPDVGFCEHVPCWSDGDWYYVRIRTPEGIVLQGIIILCDEHKTDLPEGEDKELFMRSKE